MQPNRGVLARVLMTVLSLAIVAGAILAARPASARGVAARRADALADAASAALASLVHRAEIRQEVPGRMLVIGSPDVSAAEAAYADALLGVASLAAPRAGVDVPGLDQAWTLASDQRMTAVLAALSQVGVPYRGYKAIPGYGFDCSGLTSWAWSVAGVGLPHNSSAQIAGATPHDLAAVQPGDLVQYPGHVMLALGYGHAVVHAPRTGQVIEVESWHRARRAGSPV